MQIQIDSREKPRAIQKIVKYFDNNGIKHYSSKLFVGDYMNLDNPRLVIDRKQNLTELCGNVTQQHKRFKDEILRANEHGIKVVFLIEHNPQIKCLEDVRNWKNPRLKFSPQATTGEMLYRILYTIRERYGVEFLFCHKGETGRKIVEILGGFNER